MRLFLLSICLFLAVDGKKGRKHREKNGNVTIIEEVEEEQISKHGSKSKLKANLRAQSECDWDPFGYNTSGTSNT
jgi:hypothetical protein